MRYSLILSFFAIQLFCSNAFSQTWTTLQIQNANTTINNNQMTKEEKDCILYINLCRMYPSDFLKFELLDYNGNLKYGDYIKNSAYKQSLITHLQNMSPTHALYFDQGCYDNASCFSVEQGIAGTTGHERINCPKGNYAECCSYGMSTAKDIVMQLLIDDGVPSLGHRINCLNPDYTKIAVSLSKHKKWEFCAVIDMIW